MSEGVQLSETEKKYLLPHFTMLVVGKPGSGKTSTVQYLLNDKDFYRHKFDTVLALSPSVTKMGLMLKKSNVTQSFSLSWIEYKLFELNYYQAQLIYERLRQLNLIEKFDPAKLTGMAMQTQAYQTSKVNGIQYYPLYIRNFNYPQVPNLFADNNRFFTYQLKYQITYQASDYTIKAASKSRAKSNAKNVGDLLMGGAAAAQGRMSLAYYVDEMYYYLYLKLPIEERKAVQKNCLIIFDDMISYIKANEFNPLLTQLIFNRRHLLLGGCVSVMIVAQKYTMIPARVRSNANWLLLFRLNPADFDAVYKDVVMMTHDYWSELLEFVFGGSDVEKKFSNLGIWVEKDKYFMNFRELEFSGHNHYI